MVDRALWRSGHLGLCLGYVPALAYGSCRVSVQGTILRASDLHNARSTILNPFNNTYAWLVMGVISTDKLCHVILNTVWS